MLLRSLHNLILIHRSRASASSATTTIPHNELDPHTSPDIPPAPAHGRPGRADDGEADEPAARRLPPAACRAPAPDEVHHTRYVCVPPPSSPLNSYIYIHICPAILQFAQEILATHLAGLPARRVPADAPLHTHVLARARIDARAIKMAAYGAFVSAPLGHALVGLLQRAFAGHTGVRVRVLQILASNLIVSPIQISGA